MFCIQFHLEQAKLRSKIRIDTGRGTTYPKYDHYTSPNQITINLLTVPILYSHSLAPSAKPIDVLAKYISSTAEEDLDIEVQEPYLLLCGLNIVDLEDLLEDIKVYREMEMNSNSEFWLVRCHQNPKVTRKTPYSRSFLVCCCCHCCCCFLV